MPKSLHGETKLKRHFTLTDTAINHLAAIAGSAKLSRSEALERLIRGTAAWEGEALLSDEAWEWVHDHSQGEPELDLES